MKVLLFGANGMLGRAIRQVAPDDFEIVPSSYRFHNIPSDVGATIFPDDIDAVINAAGRLREHDQKFEAGGDVRMTYVNSVVPHLLARQCEQAGIPLFQVSSDCAQAPHESLYAATKLAGESQYATNIRTSFVGPDHGLWRWVLDQAEKGETIEAWTRWMWSGSTVWAVAEGILKIAHDRTGWDSGGTVVNLATRTPIAKSEVVHTLRLLYARGSHAVDTWEPESTSRVMAALGYVLPPFLEAMGSEWVPKP